MPEEPENPRNLPGRHRPRLTDLAKETTEEDLWDLEGETDPAPVDPPPEAEPAPAPKQPMEGPPPAKKAPAKPKEPAVSRRDTNRGQKRRPANEDATPPSEPMKASRPNGPRRHDPKSTTEFPSQPKPQPEPKPAEPKPAEPKPEPPKPQAKSEQPKAEPTPETPQDAKIEKIGLITLGVVFLGVALWWIVSLFSSIETTRIGDDQPDFPIKGTNLTIDEADTYWREPVRDGEFPDVARSEVEFIPVLSVTIDDSETGVLRVIFRNNLGDFVGDSISQPFANGVFDQNAKPTIEFPATDGLMNSGDFNGYRTGDHRWTVEVFEGPSADAPGSEFKLLFDAPISSKRQ